MPAQEAIDLKYDTSEAARDFKEETRTRRLKNAYLDSKPAICMERALAFTRSYKETEGQATTVRLAKAFRLACETISLNIFDDELIVGTHGSGRRMGALVPEISWKWLAKELDSIQTRPRDPYYIDPEQERLFVEEIIPYWKGKSLEENALARFPEDTLKIGVDTD